MSAFTRSTADVYSDWAAVTSANCPAVGGYAVNSSPSTLNVMGSAPSIADGAC